MRVYSIAIGREWPSPNSMDYPIILEQNYIRYEGALRHSRVRRADECSLRKKYYFTNRRHMPTQQLHVTIRWYIKDISRGVLPASEGAPVVTFPCHVAVGTNFVAEFFRKMLCAVPLTSMWRSDQAPKPAYTLINLRGGPITA